MRHIGPNRIWVRFARGAGRRWAMPRCVWTAAVVGDSEGEGQRAYCPMKEYYQEHIYDDVERIMEDWGCGKVPKQFLMTRDMFRCDRLLPNCLAKNRCPRDCSTQSSSAASTTPKTTNAPRFSWLRSGVRVRGVWADQVVQRHAQGEFPLLKALKTPPWFERLLPCRLESSLGTNGT